MANKTNVALLLIVFSSLLLFMNSEARVLQNRPFIRKNINSLRLLHELGYYDLSKQMMRHGRVMEEVGHEDRPSPGGPNPKHNRESPPKFY
ncbi:CLAVATA3/ESR (CLE)-related protein 5-like [Prosopis cineraria]|uniref:CLAVATA3/ESR (CLE)-related protein 5-like n=1 Tax=Prosopis cineraria TaxID=364024 RepID=UPI0024109A89|nr:CLAVATA3/ESR (CLE)-related protein 5-like [Prosopis cineraria]